MTLTATPTLPLEVPIGAMLDIPDFPDEYATLAVAEPIDGATSLIVKHKGELISVTVPDGELVTVVNYAASNALDI